MSANNFSERQLVRIWQYQLLDRKGLVTEDGEKIEVVYPGRINDEQGADFRNTVISTSRGLIKGDVEVHIRSSDWRNHQHHLNSTYNRVILHVVMWHNTGTVTRLQNGREVPVLALNRYVAIPDIQRTGPVSYSITPGVPCLNVARCLDRQAVTKLLARAGEERFLGKSEKFKKDLGQMEASQSIYQGIMGALGYSKNKLPFIELAHRLPLFALESVTQGDISNWEYLTRHQALLLGTAGLLHARFREIYRRNGLGNRRLRELEKLWNSLQHTRAMTSSAWNLFKVRPNNSPIRRLVAMSYLLLRYRKKGLLKGLVGLIEEVSLKRGYYRLEKGLQVTIIGCQANHTDFYNIDGTGRQTLLGRSRAADIIVNILLPFSFALSQVTPRPELVKKALHLYHLYPRLAVNSVERHVAEQLGLSYSLIDTARYQQGLIHIYNNLCIQGRCDKCYLSQSKVGDYVQV